MKSQVLALLAAATSSAVAQEYYSYTATPTAAVNAAQATAKTSSPTSHVKGKAFDRIAIIWLENTDYDLAIGDRKCATAPSKNITSALGPMLYPISQNSEC